LRNEISAPENWSIALMMETARTSETLVNFYQTTRRYNPEDSHLQLKSQLMNYVLVIQATCYGSTQLDLCSFISVILVCFLNVYILMS
jgi:hypothetical protein